MVKSIFYGSFHLSGPKFDIAVEMFCAVEFSNFLLGQKFVAVEFSNFSKKCKVWSLEGRFFGGRPSLSTAKSMGLIVSDICLLISAPTMLLSTQDVSRQCLVRQLIM